MAQLTDNLRRKLSLLQTEAAGHATAWFGPAAECRVDTESAPETCRFHMRIVRGGVSLTQSAHVPISMIAVMPLPELRPFVRELMAGAFQCKCNCPDECSHDWSGPFVPISEGRGGEVTCIKCGAGRMAHDMLVLP